MESALETIRDEHVRLASNVNGGPHGNDHEKSDEEASTGGGKLQRVKTTCGTEGMTIATTWEAIEQRERGWNPKRLF